MRLVISKPNLLFTFFEMLVNAQINVEIIDLYEYL